MSDYTFRRGDICWYRDDVFREEGTYVLHGKRPVVVVSNDAINATSGTIIVAPMTCSKTHRLYPNQVDIFLNGTYSRIRCEQLRVVDKSQLEPPPCRYGQRRHGRLRRCSDVRNGAGCVFARTGRNRRLCTFTCKVGDKLLV